MRIVGELTSDTASNVWPAPGSWIQQHVLGVYGNLRILIISTRSVLCHEVEWGRTKVDNVKHSPFSSFTDGREDAPIITSRDANNSLQGRPVVLDEFDTRLLLLPQLQVSIHRGSQQESSPGISRILSRSQTGFVDSLGHGDEI